MFQNNYLHILRIAKNEYCNIILCHRLKIEVLTDIYSCSWSRLQYCSVPRISLPHPHLHNMPYNLLNIVLHRLKT